MVSEVKLTEEELSLTGRFTTASSVHQYYLLIVIGKTGSVRTELSALLPGGKESVQVCQRDDVSLFLLTDLCTGLSEVLRLQMDSLYVLCKGLVKFCFHACSPVIGGAIHREVFEKEICLGLAIAQSAAAGQIFIIGNSTGIDAMGFPLHLDVQYIRHGIFSYKARYQPVEIWEAYVEGIVKPHAPVDCKKKNEKISSALGWVSASVLLLVIVSMIASINMFVTGEKREAKKKEEDRAKQAELALQVEPIEELKQTETESSTVFFRGLYWTTIFLDGDLIATTPVEGEVDLKKSLTAIEPGIHVIHVEGGPVVRYYSEIDVEPGENIIGLKFYESTLSSLEAEYEFDPEDEDGLVLTKSFYYVIYDNDTKVKNGISAAMRIEILPFDEDEKEKNKDKPVVADENKQDNFYLLCYLSLNGEKKLNKKMVIPKNSEVGPEYDMNPVRVYEDENHYFYITYRTEFNKIKFTLGGAFL